VTREELAEVVRGHFDAAAREAATAAYERCAHYLAEEARQYGHSRLGDAGEWLRVLAKEIRSWKGGS
jgi:hypothetical protein